MRRSILLSESSQRSVAISYSLRTVLLISPFAEALSGRAFGDGRVLRTRLTGTLIAIVALLSALDVFAFDGNRKGFQLGVGVGVHGGSVEDYEAGFASSSGADGGLATSFKVGFGFSNRFSLYYVRNASWFRMQAGVNDPFYYLAGISGVGASFYVNGTARSPYLLIAAGRGDYGAPFEGNRVMRETSSFMVGAGYEFSRRHMLEATALFVEIDQDFDDTVQLGRSAQLTYNYLLY